MDHSKISRTAASTQTQTTPPTRQAGPALKSRFLSALEQGAAKKERAPRSSGVPAYTLLAMSGSQAKPTAAAPMHRPPTADMNAELSALLERACSAMYVSDRSTSGQRVVLSLDPVLAGAAAEIVRDGAHLRIKLLARTEAAYRSMSSQRHSLIKALGIGTDQSLQIEVLDVHRSRGGSSMAADG
jgi:hypothetical protein